MKRDLLDLASSLTRRGVSFVMATVVRREGARAAPFGAHLGDSALLTAEGLVHGWIGSREIAAILEREAARVLLERRPCLLCLSSSPEGEPRRGVTVIACDLDGVVELYLAPMISAPRLVLFGSSPTAAALASLARTIGYRVDLVELEPAPGEAKRDGRGLGADRVFHALDDPRLTERDSEGLPVMAVVSPAAERSPEAAYARGAAESREAREAHDARDEAMLAAAVGLAPLYLGVIVSRRRFTLLRDALARRGLAAAADRIAHPAGLALGAHDPGEVAVGILAQMIARRNGVAAVNEASVTLSETSEVTSTMDIVVDDIVVDNIVVENIVVDNVVVDNVVEGPSGPLPGTPAATASCFPSPVVEPMREGDTGATLALRVRASSPALETRAARAASPSAVAVATSVAAPRLPPPPLASCSLASPSDGTPTVPESELDEAIDPVCQASVTISEARHVGTWQGLTWYFCCAACRAKFLANPLRYAAFAPGSSGPPP